MPTAGLSPGWRVEKPVRLLVDRASTRERDDLVAEVSLENEIGHRSEPFECRSEKAVEEVVGTLIHIYPEIDIVRTDPPNSP